MSDDSEPGAAPRSEKDNKASQTEARNPCGTEGPDEAPTPTSTEVLTEEEQATIASGGRLTERRRGDDGVGIEGPNSA